MAVALIAGPRGNAHQAGIQHLHTAQGQTLHPEINGQGGVVMVVEGLGFASQQSGRGDGPVALARVGDVRMALADSLQQGVDAHGRGIGYGNSLRFLH